MGRPHTRMDVRPSDDSEPTADGETAGVPARLLAEMKLDVASDQVAGRAVAVGKGDREGVVASRLTVVRDGHIVGSHHSIDLARAGDAAGRRAEDRVARDPGSLHLEADAVIDVREVSPETVLLEATGDRERAPRAGGRTRNPSSAGDEVLVAGGLRGATDVGVRGSDDDVSDSGHDDTKRVDRDAGALAARVGRGDLLVDDDVADRKRHGLVGFTADRDRLSVYAQYRDLRAAGNGGAAVAALRLRLRLQEVRGDRVSRDG